VHTYIITDISTRCYTYVKFLCVYLRADVYTTGNYDKMVYSG